MGAYFLLGALGDRIFCSPIQPALDLWWRMCRLGFYLRAMVNKLQPAHSGQLSSNTKHSNLPRSHNKTTSIFICMWLTLVQVIDWVFAWNQIYHLGWNMFQACGFQWAPVSLVWTVLWVIDMVNDVVGQNWLVLLRLFFEVWFMCLVAKKLQEQLGFFFFFNSTYFYVNFFKKIMTWHF